jgi:hypothetical protein
VTKTIDIILEAIRERIRNPIVPAVVIAWCSYNWPVVLYFFFGDIKPDRRFELVNDYLTQFPVDSILVPLIASAAYVGLMPLLVEQVNKWQRIAYDRDRDAIL